MKYQVRYSKEFKKGLKKLKNDTKSLELVKEIIIKLANDETLEAKHKDHKLSVKGRDNGKDRASSHFAK